MDDVTGRRLTRRSALKGAGGLLAAGSMAALLEACGSSSSSSTASTGGSSSSSSAAAAQTGTLTLLTYPGWYGPHEFADFEKLHPGITIKTAVSGTTGAAAQIAQIATNPGVLRHDARRSAGVLADARRGRAGTARHGRDTESVTGGRDIS